MKTFATTLCIIGTALAVSACSTTENSSYDSGSNFATERTAGEVSDAAVQPERVFREVQTK